MLPHEILFAAGDVPLALVEKAVRQMQPIIQRFEDIAGFLIQKAVPVHDERGEQPLRVKGWDELDTAQRFLQTGDLFKVADAVYDRLLHADHPRTIYKFYKFRLHRPMGRNTAIAHAVIFKAAEAAFRGDVHLIEHLIGIAVKFKGAVVEEAGVLRQL